VKTLKIVAAALAAAALLGEEGCTNPQRTATTRASATPNPSSRGAFVGGGAAGAGAAGAGAAANGTNDRNLTAKSSGNTAADGESSRGSGFGESGGAHGSGG
jgi:hypothetical protein